MLDLAIDAFMVCLPLYGLYSQLNLIKRQKSMGSFSIYITAILILCNLLKIFFWFSVGFALSMLVQSVLIAALCLCILYECVKLSNHPQQKNMFKQFWKWPTYQLYFDFLAILCLVLVPLTILSRLEEFKLIGEMIGFVASVIEIGTGVPLMVENFKKKSTKGVSVVMIGIWTFSDSFKTVYFLMNNQPVQFVMTSVCCLVFDLAIALEMVVYGDGPKQSTTPEGREQAKKVK